MPKTNKSPLPPLQSGQLNETAKRVVQAAERSAKKLREQKQKLVIFTDGKVQTVKECFQPLSSNEMPEFSTNNQETIT